MATNYFSSNYSTGAITAAPGDAQTALANPQRKIETGIKHARMRVNVCYADLDGVTLAESDTIRFCTLNSGDRILSIKWATDGVFTDNTDMDLGIYAVGDAHDGAVVDSDLFGASLDLGGSGSALAETIAAGVVTEWDPGRLQLFEMADLGAYSKPSSGLDPLIKWDLVGLIDTVSTAEGKVLVVVTYTAGE
jgi:hypothetical protein